MAIRGLRDMPTSSRYLPQFARYVMSGGLATGVHYIVLVALVESSLLAPVPAAMLGAACGALVAYTGNRRFTFDSRARHRTALPRFLLVAASGVALNGALVAAGTAKLAWHYLAAQVAATIVVVTVTYQLNRRWTF